jgi:hypothetical protein
MDNEDADSSAARKERRRPFLGQAKLATQRPFPGRYRHYKGQEYEVIETAKHCDSLQAFVVYRALYGDRSLWIRPRSDFLETVELGGKRVKRFAPVDLVD